ncbi:MAG: SRPBCC domain-containing protein [Candidatus Acidiferrum sp.]
MSELGGVFQSELGRREFSRRVASMISVAGMGGGVIFVAGDLEAAGAQAGADGISHNNDAIHQEVVFHASRKRVYEALTDGKQFEKVVLLSDAMKSKMVQNSATTMGPEAGSAFSTYGGYVSGRQIELVPGERIVQAWRAGSWPEGAYSIAKFVLTEQGDATKLVFDHTGFPPGTAEHLALGWKANYWEPLAKFLA